MTYTFTYPDGTESERDLNLDFDEKTDEFVAAYIIDDEIVNVGRGSSVNRAVLRLAEQMNGDIDEALGSL